ncbi:MAG TPA: hypothetical protein VMT37_12640 [Solirubrobacterales bacterium]|nr:hypothetical protein [Solirubrobacterales bacterium]
MTKFRTKARRGLILAAAFGAMAAIVTAGIAAGAGSKEKACVSNVCFEAGGTFTPKKLSKTKQTPIALAIEGAIKTTDGSHPPALTEAIVETDKNGAINVTGYPKCKKSQLQSRDSKHAKAACEPALIGTGTTDVAIAFPESKDIIAHSQLLVFNGGQKGATTTLFIHAYITVPVPAAIVTTVKITKIHNGRYGLKSVATIPKIASGSGSVTAFKLKIDKKFTYKGKKVSVLTAKCPDGRLQAHAVAKFANGLTATTEYVRPCTGV